MRYQSRGQGNSYATMMVVGRISLDEIYIMVGDFLECRMVRKHELGGDGYQRCGTLKSAKGRM